jgi:hypothetical protein
MELRAIKHPNGISSTAPPLIIATLDRRDWEEIRMIAFLCVLCVLRAFSACPTPMRFPPWNLFPSNFVP